MPVKFDQQQPSLGDMAQVIKRRKWSLILPALIIIVAALLVALLLPSIYRSTATILIEEQEIPAEFVKATVTSYAEERIQTIKQRVMSFTRLNDLVNRFNLYRNLRDTWTMEQIVSKMKEDIKLEPVSAEVVDPRTGRPKSATIAFTLSYEGKNPETVQQVANTLTSLYLTENQQVREKQTAETSQFLEAEMNRLKAELAELDGNIATFKESHINELPEMMQTNLQAMERTEREKERLADQIRTLKDRQGYLEAQIAGLSPNFGNEDKKRFEELKVQLVHLQTQFSDKHPDVVKAKREIADLEKQIQSSRDSGRAGPGDAASDNPAHATLSAQLASTRFEIESTARQIESLRAKAEQYRKRIEASPKVEKAYNALILERNNTQVKYNDLTAKYMESQVAHGLEKERKGERFTLIDPPRFPDMPVKPNRLAILLIGIVLGIGAGVGFAAIREFSDRSVRDVKRLAVATPYPVLAGIPVIETRADITRRRVKAGILSAAVVVVIAGGLIAFHNLVMDLNILWTKITLRLSLFV